MLATQMESADARRMFPSWDEPAFRATYRLSVTVPKSFDAVSNMPATSQTVSGSTKTVRFARTPSMASYLVVLCAGEFGYLQGKSDGITVRVVAPKGREQNGHYALDAAEKLLAYYDGYFGVKYPLPKLDLIAVPGGFPGAMENWGGITFTQQALLFEPSIEPQSAKQGIFETIAHEMSHQWFGDLVTMAWWDNLWLNEGFADWMQTKASDHFNPQWHLWERVNGDVEAAMSTDGQSTTHPVQTPIEDETQAEAAFDEITYQKGGAFIRMLEQYLGEATFRDGIRQYVHDNAYSNTTSANLYSALGNASHQDVAAFARAWTTEPGFPLVEVDESCSGGHVNLALSQHRFFYEPDQSSQQLWQIPLSIASAFHPDEARTVLMTEVSKTLDSQAPCAEPVLANAGAVGYFRVAYDPATSTKLIADLPRLAPVDRVRVLADTHALVVAGKAQPADLLGAIDRIQNDDNLAVWNVALNALNAIGNYEIGKPGEVAFDAYRRATLQNVYQRLGWSGTSSDPTVMSLRRRVLEALGDAGDQRVIAEARRRYAAFLKNHASLSTDLKGTVLDIVGTYADEATWEQLRALAKSSKDADEAQVYLSAMWGARDPALARKNLQMTLNGDIPAEAGPITALYDIGAVALAGRQPKLAWEFYKANDAKLLEHFSSFERSLFAARFLPAFWNGAPPAELEAYAKAHIPPQLSAQLAQANHQIELTVATADRVVPAVDRWVAAHPSGTTAGR
ncbi:MAG: M1 family metallopeptidase [Candidatus Eremiobacteraeota bacterium]|nr:M1 family metallopeptidase [Candidatus Eremiobacteraeota bacterium]